MIVYGKTVSKREALQQAHALDRHEGDPHWLPQGCPDCRDEWIHEVYILLLIMQVPEMPDIDCGTEEFDRWEGAAYAAFETKFELDMLKSTWGEKLYTEIETEARKLITP